MPRGTIRIIAGTWRGRKLAVADKPDLRPTADRLRETLFNWLAFDVPNSRCLDLFAGTGALGLEAASRGAQQVVLVEQDRALTRSLQTTLNQWQAATVTVVCADALHYLQKTATPFDLVFLDPPFKSNILSTVCVLLEENGWLSEYAYIYLEMAKNSDEPSLPATWKVRKRQQAGQVCCLLAQREPSTAH